MGMGSVGKGPVQGLPPPVPLITAEEFGRSLRPELPHLMVRREGV
jgi:hypothetical protein